MMSDGFYYWQEYMQRNDLHPLRSGDIVYDVHHAVSFVQRVAPARVEEFVKALMVAVGPVGDRGWHERTRKVIADWRDRYGE